MKLDFVFYVSWSCFTCDMEIVTFEKCKVHACNHGNKVSTRIHLFQLETFKWYSIELREKLCYVNVAEGWIVDFC